MTVEPARVVLQDVPRVSFGDDPAVENVPFPSCVRAYLDFMGLGMGSETIAAHGRTYQRNIAYTHVMGTSGAAFRLVWMPGWHVDNTDIVHLAKNPIEPYRRAFDSVGLAFEMLESNQADEAAFRQAIVTHIRDHQRPVLAFGVIGPPECCLITGYDEGGDVLIGWNYFQNIPPFNAGVEYEPGGEFRKRDWFRETPALYLITGQKPRPPQAEIYRDALQWALTVARPSSIRHRITGLAAYDAWTDQLRQDADFATDDAAALNERHMTHHDTIGAVAEGRWYAYCFMHLIMEAEPAMADDLQNAADCYKAEHDLMWKIWNLMGGYGHDEAKVRLFAEPEVRSQMIPLIHEARDKDAEAIQHIERALAR